MLRNTHDRAGRKKKLTQTMIMPIIRRYKVVKLLDYQNRIEELQNNQNPFAMVILVQLVAMKKRKNEKHRLLTKLEFFRALHKHGWSTEKSMNMYKYLDTMLGLHPKYQLQYVTEAKKIDREFSMSFTTIAERYGFAAGVQQGVQQGEQQGLQQGLQQGMQQGMQYGEARQLKTFLRVKFKNVPEIYIKKIDTADVDTLNQWAINCVHARSLDEVFIDVVVKA